MDKMSLSYGITKTAIFDLRVEMGESWGTHNEAVLPGNVAPEDSQDGPHRALETKVRPKRTNGNGPI